MSSIRSLRSVVHDMHEVFEAGNWPTIGDLRDLQNWSHRASVEYCSGDKKALLAHQAALAHNLAANLPRREQLELVYRLLGVEVEVLRSKTGCVYQAPGFEEALIAGTGEKVHFWNNDLDVMTAWGPQDESKREDLPIMAACCVRAMLDGEGA